MKSLLTRLLVLCLLIAVLSAQRAAARTEVVLRFPSWQQDEPGVSGWWKEQIAAFERARPGVRIEFTKVPLAEHTDKLIAQFAAGQPPHIVHVPAQTFFPFADRGWLEPLDRYLEETDVKKTYHPLQARTCVWKGTTYCVLMLNYGYAWVYNAKLLKAAGKSVPRNVNEYIDTLKSMTDAKNGQYGIGIVTLPGFTMVAHIAVFVYGAGGRWTDDRGMPSVTSPQVAQGFRWWKEAVLTATPIGQESGRLRQLLMEGKVASYNDGPWMQGFALRANPDVKPHLRAAPLPFQATMGGPSNVVAIPKAISDDEKRLVWEFIKNGTTKEAQVRYSLAVGAPAPRQDITIPAHMRKDLPFFDVYVDAAKRAVSWIPFGLETKANEFIRLVSEHAQRMIVRNEPVERVLQDLQKELEALKWQ
ncbi:MAG: sugar ABC transporter substrate-binding protein [Armatimonadota bacterium]|nr:sugar ABC transporter substrate-binding protein [Armatimonadota bacterium]